MNMELLLPILGNAAVIGLGGLVYKAILDRIKKNEGNINLQGVIIRELSDKISLSYKEISENMMEEYKENVVRMDQVYKELYSFKIENLTKLTKIEAMFKNHISNENK